MVNGYAAGPMLWWFEWVDQNERWGTYRALQAYLSGEDLRETEDSPHKVKISERKVTAVNCGLSLGYVLVSFWDISLMNDG